MGNGGGIAPDAIERRKYLAKNPRHHRRPAGDCLNRLDAAAFGPARSLIIAGKTAQPANLHSLYIVLEFVKLFALVVIAFGAARQLVRLPANSSS